MLLVVFGSMLSQLALLSADQEQPGSVVTSTDPVNVGDGILVAEELRTGAAQVLANCVTVNLCTAA